MGCISNGLGHWKTLYEACICMIWPKTIVHTFMPPSLTLSLCPWANYSLNHINRTLDHATSLEIHKHMYLDSKTWQTNHLKHIWFIVAFCQTCSMQGFQNSFSWLFKHEPTKNFCSFHDVHQQQQHYTTNRHTYRPSTSTSMLTFIT